MFSFHTTTEEFENRGFTLKTHQMFSVHTTTEEFENGGFTLKTHQMFSFHTTTEEFENGGFTLKTHLMFSVHTTTEEFENGGFTLKTHQMFSFHTTTEEFENGGFTLKTHQVSTLRQRNLKTQQSPATLDLCLRKTLAEEYHDYRDVITISLSKPRSINLVSRSKRATSGLWEQYWSQTFAEGNDRTFFSYQARPWNKKRKALGT